jgi:hypothetical protein
MTALALGWHGSQTWNWLTSSPLFGITVTLAAYAVGRWLHARTRSPAFQPVLVAIVLIVLLLKVCSISYADYLTGGGYVGFWLGAATVSLALPLHAEWHLVRRRYPSTAAHHGPKGGDNSGFIGSVDPDRWHSGPDCGPDDPRRDHRSDPGPLGTGPDRGN